MQSDIRDAALRLGNVEARAITGHPFDVWHDRLKSIPLGQHLSFEHDPVMVTGWPLGEITIWAAIAPTPPITDWPEDCGEIGSFYMRSQLRRARRAAWTDAALALGYELKQGVMIPERAAAIRAGLGGHGLNGLMISPGYGSFVDITVLIVHAAPPTGARGPEYDLSPGCGDCGECIKACPTGAISAEGVNTLVCLRHYMNKLEDLPEQDYPKMGKRILGCESCQLVCPKNAGLAHERPPADMADRMRIEKLLSDPDIECICKYVRLGEVDVKTMAVLAAANTGRKDLLPLVERLVGSEDKVLDKVARWAVNRLR